AFLFGDLHAHVMAQPYTMVILALVIHLARQGRDRADAGFDPTRREESAIGRTGEAVALGLLGITTGALWPINTWDVPPCLALVMAGLVIREAGRRGALDASALTTAAWRLLMVAGLGRLVFHPFFAHFAS